MLAADLAEVQNVSPPATKATLKAQQRLMKKERLREKEAALVAKEVRQTKKQKKYESMQAKSQVVKAESMMKIADGQNLKTFYEIAKDVMSPESLKQTVSKHLTDFSSSVLNFKSSVDVLEESSDSEVEVVETRKSSTPKLSTPKTSTPIPRNVAPVTSEKAGDDDEDSD